MIRLRWVAALVVLTGLFVLGSLPAAGQILDPGTVSKHRVSNVNVTELIENHQRAMRPSADFFAGHPVRVEYIEGEIEHGKRIRFFWQNGQFRSEFNWLGFTEVFAYDGTEHWYGSDLDLPYALNPANGPDITPQLVNYFHYLTPRHRMYLGTAGEIPLNLDQRFAVLKYSPPGMSEALLLLDPLNYRLAGMLKGSSRELAEADVYTLTLYEEWADFGQTLFPTVVHIITYSLDGDLLRERFVTTQLVQAVEPMENTFFSPVSSPPVTIPDLPAVPFEVPFYYSNNNIMVYCRAEDGHRYKMELDTGAMVGLLRRDVAEQLGLELSGDEQVMGHGGTTGAQFTRVENMRLEGAQRDILIELPPFPAAVLSENTKLDESLADSGVSGLLGSFVLNNFILKLDYRRRRIYLYPPDQFDPDIHLEPGYHAIPVQRASQPYVEITVDDKIQGGAFFNTGAQQMFALCVWAIDNAGMCYEVEGFSPGSTVGGYTQFPIVTVGKVEMGDIVITEPTTHLEMLAPGEAPNPNRIASFGNSFFERYIVTFDLFNNYYYIEGI